MPPPACACVPACVTRFAFPAVASATDEFVWVTGPSFPGLSTRTTMFTLVGARCVDVASASAVCFVGALCWADCDWPAPAEVAGSGGGAADCVWVLLWVVAFALPAELVALLVLLCSACRPPLPTFVAACVDVAVDPPLCSV